MKKTNPTPLSTEGSFESIVNAGTHERRRQEHKRVRKMLVTIVVALAMILINMILWLLNAIQTVPSLWITGICTAVACFAAGRLYEICSK